MTSFFAAYDTLCEEGTATPVCKALNEVADVSVPGNAEEQVDVAIVHYLSFTTLGIAKLLSPTIFFCL